MSMIATNAPTAPMFGGAASNVGGGGQGDVVEISLLLPSQWANDLVELSRERHQSVAQILRSMIGQALHEGDSGR
jgi:hypothetical protein